jgi:mRNA-degrading endonuclease RelE of RelBE toxin-antitoxin system
MNEPTKSRLAKALQGLGKEPPEGDITPLVVQNEHWRLRKGGMRILYKIENGTIFVTHIESRGQAYKKGNRG